MPIKRTKLKPFTRFLSRLSVRVVLASTALVIIGMIIVASIITGLYRDAISRSFDELIALHSFNLVGAVSLTANRTLIGAPQLGDSRYNLANSGWYWTVKPLDERVSGQLKSISLLQTPQAQASVILPSKSEVPLDQNFQRVFDLDTSDGLNLRVLEREVSLGNADDVAVFTIMASKAQIIENEYNFQNQVHIWLIGLGALLILINAFAIMAGLFPLKRAQQELALVASGEEENLIGPFPPEIEPLVNEINALVADNRQVVARARTQVGDLAHSLKTPLSVIVNEARQQKTGSPLIVEQAAAIKNQIDRYLQKARIAAQQGGTAFRCDVHLSTEKLVRVFKKLNPELSLTYQAPTVPLIFAGEEQDFEELLGNILENACKWTQTSVMISTDLVASNGGPNIQISVADDGPGIPHEQRSKALGRGLRLDETKPGTGLGLSIVKELIDAYQGHLELDETSGGGLTVRITLPKIA